MGTDRLRGTDRQTDCVGPERSTQDGVGVDWMVHQTVHTRKRYHDLRREMREVLSPHNSKYSLSTKDKIQLKEQKELRRQRID